MNIEEAFQFLTSKGAFQTDPNRRRSLSATVANYGMDVRTLRAVWSACQIQGKTSDQCVGLFVKKLQNPADAMDLADDYEAQEAIRKGANEGGKSGMEWVTGDNPWGWEHKEAMAFMDHDRPSEWNAYRQDYNYTAAQRAENNLTDHKVRYCTRIEEVGATKRMFSQLFVKGD